MPWPVAAVRKLVVGQVISFYRTQTQSWWMPGPKRQRGVPKMNTQRQWYVHVRVDPALAITRPTRVPIILYTMQSYQELTKKALQWVQQATGDDKRRFVETLKSFTGMRANWIVGRNLARLVKTAYTPANAPLFLWLVKRGSSKLGGDLSVVVQQRADHSATIIVVG